MTVRPDRDDCWRAWSFESFCQRSSVRAVSDSLFFLSCCEHRRGWENLPFQYTPFDFLIRKKEMQDGLTRAWVLTKVNAVRALANSSFVLRCDSCSRLRAS